MTNETNDDHPENENVRLSRITTHWDEINAAHSEDADEHAINQARHSILNRYGTCIHKYILGAVKNADVAEDLAQEFALRFVRGDYRNVDPAKGRFRDYLKVSLRNLATDHFRKKSAVELSVSQAERIPQKGEVEQIDRLENEFQIHWRQQLLGHTWEQLREFDRQNDNAFYVVLRMRADDPEADSKQMAERHSESSGNKVTSEWVRQKLHRARKKFAEFLVAEVRKSLQNAGEDEIQSELNALGLKKYL